MKKFIFVLFIILYGCEGTKEISKTDINIVPMDDSILYVSDIANLCEIIQFENNKNGMLSDVQKIQVVDSFVYVYDEGGMPAIIKFDHNGKYIGNIGKIGHGKTEYEFIYDFAVNKKSENVVVLTGGNVVKIYDLSGKYICTKILGNSETLNLKKIINVSDGYVCSSYHQGINDGKMLYIYDKDFNLLYDALEQVPNRITSQSFILNPMYSNENDICYFDFHLHTFNLMLYNNPNFHNTFRLTTENMVDIEDFKDGYFFNHLTNFDFVDSYLYCGNYALVNICIDSSLYFTRINFKDTSVIAYRNGWFPKFDYYSDGFIYSIMTPEELLSLCDKNKPCPDCIRKWIRPKAESFIKNYSNLNNFVLLKMKLKE